MTLTLDEDGQDRIQSSITGVWFWFKQCEGRLPKGALSKIDGFLRQIEAVLKEHGCDNDKG